MELLAGFILGLTGSLHCAGMCGPIALALPRIENRPVFVTRLFYNFGRIACYSLFGVLFGLLGSKLEMFGIQSFLSIAAGVIIFAALFIPRTAKSALLNSSGILKAAAYLKSFFVRLLNRHSYISMFGLGVINGLLPCGFIYIAAAGAAAIGTPFESMLFMAMFGVGTLPLMLGIGLAKNIMPVSSRKKLGRLIPAFSIFIACIFILRGLGLGIPYLSPQPLQKHAQSEQVICH